MREPGPIEGAWTDAWGRRRETPPGARQAVRDAMALSAGERRLAAQAVMMARRGDALPRGGAVTLEDGTELGRLQTLPRDVPHGYHRWHRDGGDPRLLLVAPPRCPLPRDWRTWGWAVQLYAARSRASWGMGDLVDLRRLAAWSAGLGAGALLVSPLGATNPAPDPEPSPYYPSSRRFRDPLYLAIENVPGYRFLASELAPVARAGRALNGSPAIVRSEVRRHKLAALERLWRASPAAGPSGPQPDGLTAAPWPDLQRWGLFAALSEEHGPGWQAWPAELHDPDGIGVRRESRRLADRVAFHVWVQRLLDRQLAVAGSELPLIGDLPIGFDPGGFDAWVWQGMLGAASLGAPPDVFNPAGQRWGLPPFVPDRLRLAGYRPVIDTIRASLAHAGGLRIDHVLGLFRQWWVPDGADPADGAYVSQPTDELLAVLAIEAERAGAVVIGEDLGTVAPGVRRRLAAANVLSTRLGYFERRPPDRWPRRALAGITTHDLPTIAGAWTGADLADQARAGVAPDQRGLGKLRRRLARLAGVASDAPLAAVIERAHAAIGASPPVLAVATLEDALRVRRRPNLPGTDRTRRDNWSRALPATLEQIERSRGIGRVARAIGRGRDRA